MKVWLNLLLLLLSSGGLSPATTDSEESTVPYTDQYYQGYGWSDHSARRGQPRRPELVAEADEAAALAKQLMSAGDWIGATEELQTALELLPDAPVVWPRVDQYSGQFHAANLCAVSTDLTKGQVASALDRIRESWGHWSAYTYLAVRSDPVNALKDLTQKTRIPQLFTSFLFLGCLVGLIRFHPDKRIRLPFYLVPFAFPAVAFLLTVMGLSVGLFDLSVGFLQSSHSIGEVIAGALLIFLLACSAASVPYLIGKIAGLRWRLHRQRNRNA